MIDDRRFREVQENCWQSLFSTLHPTSQFGFAARECSPTTPTGVQGFGVQLEPRYIIGAKTLD